MNKHAPQAPGPRPNTWWKGRKIILIKDYAYTPPPIYTRPEPRKQGVKGKQK